jgi:hypothetical protein
MVSSVQSNWAGQDRRQRAAQRFDDDEQKHADECFNHDWQGYADLHVIEQAMMRPSSSSSRIRGISLFFFVFVGLAVLALRVGVHAQNTSGEPPRSVQVQMRNVMYHFTNEVAVHIRALRGELVPTKGNIPVFDDRNSFMLRIASAEIAMTPGSLSNVLNSYVLAKADAPLKEVSIAIDGDRLRMKGKLHSKGNVPFESEAQIAASPDGKIRLHTEKIKALHLPVKGLMDLLGLKLADLIRTGQVQGVEAEKDDLILDPAKLLPPPHIAGQVTAVRLEPRYIVQVFGHEPAIGAMHVPFANYMAYRGNQLRFGKLTMEDTDMVLIDMNPSDPFDFYLDHYKEQLVAGYTKETAAFGLRVFMRDYNKLERRGTARATRNPAR